MGWGGGGVTASMKVATPVPPLSDYLGTHQCSKNAKLVCVGGGGEQSLNVREFGKNGCFYSLEFTELRIRGVFSK